ncbi:armadillo-type protein [Mycena leptocephala]|nr:armadillo-type protein [Mycena leptocephala]
MLGNLACHEAPALALIDVNPCRKLVVLSQDSETSVVEVAVRALAHIASWPTGALVVSGAGAFDIIGELLDSLDSSVRYWTDDSQDVCVSALWALTTIASWVKGTAAVVDAGALHLLDKLLESAVVEIRCVACAMLSNLAVHESTTLALGNSNLCQRLVVLLQDPEVILAEYAMRALATIASWANGALAVLDAGVLSLTDQLLESSNNWVHNWTCNLVGNLATHETTSAGIWTENRCRRLVEFSRDDVTEFAMYALSQITRWPDGAAAVVEAGALQFLEEAFESEHSGIRGWMCVMLVNLAVHECTALALANFSPCRKLVALSQDPETSVVENAVRGLAHIASWPDGALSVFEAGATDIIDELLDSLASGVRKWTCHFLGSLAHLESIAPAVWNGNRCKKLVRLLRDNDPDVASNALSALASIAYKPDGAAVLVDAGMLQLLGELVVSAHECVRLGIEPGPCQNLVALLRDEHFDVIGSACNALCWIAQSVEGAEAVIDAGADKIIDELLESLNAEVRMSSCTLLGKLATTGVWKENRCRKLVQLSGDDTPGVAESVVYALAMIAYWEDGAVAVSASMDMCDSSKPHMPRFYRRFPLKIQSMSAARTIIAVSGLVLGARVVIMSVFRDPETTVVGAALRALCWIASRADGATAVLEADTAYMADQLFQSPDSGVRAETCNLLGSLAFDESAPPVIWMLNRCRRLVELSRDDSPSVAENAVYALSRIAYGSHGAAAVVEAGALQVLDELVQSAIASVRGWTCAMLQNLAWHQSTSTALLSTNACERLVTLLRDEDLGVVNAAAHTLSIIARSAEGTQAVVGAGALEIIVQLLRSSAFEIHLWVCVTLWNVERHEFAVDALLSLNACARLVSLLSDPDLYIHGHALYVLDQFSKWPKAATAIAKRNILEHASELTKSPDFGCG